MAEAREIVKNVKPSKLFDKKLQQQVESVLEYIDQSLQYVPHARRKAMTLGEYLQRHHYFNVNVQQEFSNHILQNKIQHVIGKFVDAQTADIVDWEFAGVRTHPAIHSQED